MLSKLYAKTFKHIKTQQKFNTIVLNYSEWTSYELIFYLYFGSMDFAQYLTTTHSHSRACSPLIYQSHQPS